jgi:hypothetical protein
MTGPEDWSISPVIHEVLLVSTGPMPLPVLKHAS